MAETENIELDEQIAIRQDIKETRDSLGSKLEALEHEVKETANDAKSSVENQVKEVKKAFNLRYQVSRNPWPFVVGVVALGYLAGGRISRGKESTADTEGWIPDLNKRNGGSSSLRGVSFVDAKSTSNGHGGNPQLNSAMRAIKSTALGLLLGALGNAARDALPGSLSPHIKEMFDGVTKSFGAEPLRETQPRRAENEAARVLNPIPH